jgi:hypothetical protein
MMMYIFGSSACSDWVSLYSATCNGNMAYLNHKLNFL